MMPPDILTILDPLIQAFDVLGISYYIGGSLASSALGIFRATLDVDIVVNLRSQHVQLLVKMLEMTYYIDADMIREAIQQKASCNLIHLDTMYKVDLFILKPNAYAQEAFQRRRKELLDEERGVELFLASPEDIILNKLDWFRMGGGVSERQWNDVLGVLKVQKEHLDTEYLRYWADDLGITDLLTQAYQDAGIESEE